MPLPLKSDPAEVEWPFETPAPGSGEEAMERALWLSRMQQAMRAADEALAEEVAKINASYRAAQRDLPARAPRATDPDYLDGDYEMVGSIQSSEWGD